MDSNMLLLRILLLFCLIASNDCVTFRGINGWGGLERKKDRRIQDADWIAHKTSNVKQCLRLCWLFGACRRVTYTPEAERCALHPEDMAGTRSSLVTDPDSIVFDLTSAFLRKDSLTGCDLRPCSDTEMCAPIKNVKKYRCIPLYSQLCTASPPSVANSIMTSDGVRTMNYECKGGYVQTGPVDSSACNPATGQWSSVDMLCIYTECGPPPAVTGTLPVQLSSAGYGTAVTYVCLGGSVSTSTSMTITCQSNSQWTTPPAPCDLVICGDPPSVENSTKTEVPRDVDAVHSSMDVSQLGVSFGAQVNYTCWTGYRSTMGSNFISECRSDGTWSPTEDFVCSLIECGTPPDIANADVSNTNSLYNAIAHYTCKTGYQLNTTSRLEGKTCGVDGVWSGDDIVCLPVDCHAPLDVSLAEKNYTSTTVNSTVVYTCIDPAVLIGRDSNVRTCESSGQWSSNLVTCAAISCGPAPVVENATYPPIYDKQLRYRALYECAAGYVNHVSSIASSSMYKRCSGNGQWIGDVECRAITCGTPPAVNTATVSVSGYTYQSIANYTCNIGYRQTASMVISTCTITGLWTEVDAECLPITCNEPPPIQNAQVSVARTGDFFPYGTTASYSCDSSYVMATSNNSLTCLDGGWQNVLIRCAFVSCGDPPSVMNSTYEVRIDSSPAYVEYQCIEGFTLAVATMNIKTCLDQLWTSEDVTCVAVNCGDLPAISNGTVISTSTTFNSEAQYVCEAGFELVPANARRTCQANGNWTKEDVRCQIVDCGIPPVEANSQSEYLNTTYGSVVKYTCLTGFTAISSTSWTKTCVESGSWAGFRSGACEIIDCKTPEPIPDGYVSHNATVFNSTVVYTCNPDYALNGRSVKTCNASGQWDGDDDLRCVSQLCPLPPSVQNAAVGNLSSRAEGAKVNYECIHGYEKVGVESSAECSSNLTWSQTNFECIKIVCEQPPSLENGEVDFQDADLDSVATYTCHNGFLPINNQTTRRCLQNRVWSSEVIECIAETDTICASPPSVPNAIVSYNSLKAGSFSTYKCEIGYEHWWFEHLPCLGTYWSIVHYIHCGLIDCGTPPDIPFATKEYNSTTYGFQAKYRCHSGTTATLQENTKRCKADGFWSDNVVECIDSNTASCGIPAVVEHTNVAYNSTIAGSIATFRCSLGFTSSATDFTARCNDNGIWEMPSILCSPHDCEPEPRVENSFTRKYSSHNSLAIVYHCNTDFVHTGTSVKTCDAEGKWSNNVVECVPSGTLFCLDPPQFENAAVVYNSRVVGSFANYTCLSGFSGNTTSECLPKGRWSKTFLNCERVSCLSPPQLDNSWSADYNGIAVYDCNGGFTPIRPYRINCLENGTWSEIGGNCSQVVNDPDVACLSNPPYVEYANESVNSSAVGSVVSYTCKLGYRSLPHVWLTHTCLENGEWSNEPLLCIWTPCVDPPSISHAVVIQRYKSPGSYKFIAESRCETGYFNTATTTTISACIFTHGWTIYGPSCQLVDCKSPPQLTNTTVTVNETTYLSKAVYACSPPYFQVGYRNSSTCHANGTWSRLTSVCAACDQNPRVQNGRILVTSESTSVYGYNATYHCYDGFYFVGPSEKLVCTANYTGRPSWAGLQDGKCVQTRWTEPAVPFTARLYPEEIVSGLMKVCVTGDMTSPPERFQLSLQNETEAANDESISRPFFADFKLNAPQDRLTLTYNVSIKGNETVYQLSTSAPLYLCIYAYSGLKYDLWINNEVVITLSADSSISLSDAKYFVVEYGLNITEATVQYDENTPRLAEVATTSALGQHIG